MIHHSIVRFGLYAVALGAAALWAQQDLRDAFVGTWRLEGPCKNRVIKSSQPMDDTGSQHTASGILSIRKDPQNPKRLILLSRAQASSSGPGGTASASMEDSLVADVVSSTELRFPSQTGVLGQTQEGTGVLQGGKLIIRMRVSVKDDNFSYEGESECSYTTADRRPATVPSRAPAQRPIMNRGQN